MLGLNIRTLGGLTEVLFESLRAQVLARERDYQALIALAERDLHSTNSVKELETLAQVLLSARLNTYSAA